MTEMMDQAKPVEVLLVEDDPGDVVLTREAFEHQKVHNRLHAREEYEGTGIGLALCRKIADRHGGSIEAIGLPDRGASFVVTLPVHQPEGSYGFGLDAEALEARPAEAETIDA